MEESANLSPAKPYKSIAPPTQSALNLMGYSSQSSLGFHPQLDTHCLPANPAHKVEEESDDSESSFSSDSDSESGIVTQLEARTISVQRSNDTVQKQASSFFTQHLPPSQPAQPEHLPAPPHQLPVSKSRKKKRKSSQLRSSSTGTKKHKRSKSSPSHEQTWSSNQAGVVVAASGPLLGPSNEGQASVMSTLLVRIPLVDLRVPDSAQQQQSLEKPKATVEPIVRNPTRTPNRRNTAETEEPQSRDRYSRLLNDEYAGHDYGNRVDRSSRRWGEREATPRDHRSYGLVPRASGRASDYGRGWDREHYRGGADEYWSDNYDSTREPQRGRGYSRHPSERKRDPEYFMQEARRRKKEADKIMVLSSFAP